MDSPITATFVMHLNLEMTDFNYKKYSLENLQNWVHDAISSGEASPEEIYDTIYEAVSEEYSYHKNHAQRCHELMERLSGQKGFDYFDDFDNGFHFNFGEDLITTEKEKPNSWRVPVEFNGEDAVITLPEEVIEMKGWKDGDVLEWVNRDDGSWEIRKKENDLTSEV